MDLVSLTKLWELGSFLDSCINESSCKALDSSVEIQENFETFSNDVFKF